MFIAELQVSDSDMNQLSFHYFRPWYVETATPTPKDVVVVIDTSGSMGVRYGGSTLMQIAKEAAKTVLDTLNPNDMVSHNCNSYSNVMAW